MLVPWLAQNSKISPRLIIECRTLTTIANVAFAKISNCAHIPPLVKCFLDNVQAVLTRWISGNSLWTRPDDDTVGALVTT